MCAHVCLQARPYDAEQGQRRLEAAAQIRCLPTLEHADAAARTRDLRVYCTRSVLTRINYKHRFVNAAPIRMIHYA